MSKTGEWNLCWGGRGDLDLTSSSKEKGRPEGPRVCPKRSASAWGCWSPCQAHHTLWVFPKGNPSAMKNEKPPILGENNHFCT